MLAVPAAIVDPQYFVGTWHCGATPWQFVRLNGSASWVRVTFGPPAHPGGTAVMGYVAARHRYIYRDFHDDGAYAELSSPVPASDRRFVWSGPYFPAGAATPLFGRIVYEVVDRAHFERHFASQRPDGSLRPMGGDVCRRDR